MPARSLASRRAAASCSSPLVTEHHGRIINFPGDNALCEFASVVDAVECAVTIQRGVAERERDVPRPERIYFRIGVNLADILAEERGVYGDGVNVAARLEQLCEPGGVAVSGTAYDHVRGRLDRELEYVGERRLKNIERPVRVYRVMVARPVTTPPPRPAERQSVAVLPFANKSNDPDQDFFSDGIADDLITDLTKISGLFVASRHTAFALKGVQLDVRDAGPRLGVRYVLQGSIRKAGERIRITTQLVDSDTGGYLWAERYDRVLTDVFAVQDEITRSIVEVLKVKLLPGEEDALRKAPTGDIDAYQLYLRGQQLYRQLTRHAYEVARRLFAQAVELDPDFARAHAGIAECEACLCLHHGGCLPIEQTLATAELALRLEPTLAAAHVARGLALVAQARLDEAERAYERAIALEPEHYEAHYALGRALLPARAQGRCGAAVPPRGGAPPQRHLRAADPDGDRERAGADREILGHRPACCWAGRSWSWSGTRKAAAPPMRRRPRWRPWAIAREPCGSPRARWRWSPTTTRCSTMSPAPIRAWARPSSPSTSSSAPCRVRPPIAGPGWPRTPTSTRCARTPASRRCCGVIGLARKRPPMAAIRRASG